jgi:UDP-N-acetylmuramoyl-L-alanyl-D-glutamate--2,6-diaminopimelate ligase
VKAGNLRAQDIKLAAAGSRYTVVIDGKKTTIQTKLPGEFNVYNSLAAVAVGQRIGLTTKQIVDGIAALESVEGRMNSVQAGQKFSVIIDFAHTPDSFERLLSDLRRSTKGKLIVCFGSAGRRDESKRAIQGEIAGRFADEVILTEEDDRDIDGNDILKQIATGAKKAGKSIDADLFLILDRTEAIQFTVTRAKTVDDTVVFLGKGHEKTIERADGEHPWDELAVVRAALGELK